MNYAKETTIRLLYRMKTAPLKMESATAALRNSRGCSRLSATSSSTRVFCQDWRAMSCATAAY